MRRIQGSITIFLSLILLSILALICVCLESARAAGLQASAQMCAVSSLQSVLAGYDRILWEQYGLFFFSESDNDIDYLDDDLLSGKYGILLDAPTLDMMEAYAVFYAYDSYGTELGVFRMTTPENAEKMKEYIENRQKELLENAVNYPDIDTKIVSSLVVKTDGKWVYYIMSDNNDIALPEMEKVLYKQ